MDGTGQHHVKWNKPGLAGKLTCFLSCAESRIFLKA
jgi:hypothetical protein